ncbi:MAG: hypothetical protein MUF22_07780 [Chitinispirillaceae bacterium]|jgi:hypothetical protein|nr:hypothetical protein [Chitinispirillaceae bacterium]
MKKEKGDAAFDSVDDVLADRIISNSGDHAAKDEQPADMKIDDGVCERSEGSCRRKIILVIGVVLGLILLGITIGMAGRKRNR